MVLQGCGNLRGSKSCEVRFSTSSQPDKNLYVCVRVCVQRLCDKLYGLHKVHANYGRVFSEWSGIEKEMADGLQSAGHYMDV